MKNETKHMVLYVDDETSALTLMKRLLGDEYDLLTAENVSDGISLLDQHNKDIKVILCDQRMPRQKGVELLSYAKATYPKIVRILVTGFSDTTDTISSINHGEIFRYIEKPIRNINVFRSDIYAAVQHHEALCLNSKLSTEILKSMEMILLRERLGNLIITLSSETKYRNISEAIFSFLTEIKPIFFSQQTKAIQSEQLRNVEFIYRMLNLAHSIKFENNSKTTTPDEIDFSYYFYSEAEKLGINKEKKIQTNIKISTNLKNTLNHLLENIKEKCIQSNISLDTSDNLNSLTININTPKSNIKPENIFTGYTQHKNTGDLSLNLIARLYLEGFNSNLQTTLSFEDEKIQLTFSKLKEIMINTSDKSWIEDIFAEYGMED